jgi:hypothetical protein
MSSLRCSQCSLLNFSTATACKRCGAPLAGQAASNWESPSHDQGETFTPPNGEWSEAQAQFPSPAYYALPPLTSDSRSKKTVGIVVVAIICLVAVISIPLLLKSGKTANVASYNWQDYSPDDMSFSISMPGEPKNMSFSRGPMQMHMSSVEMGKQTAFAVMYTDLPPEAMNLSVDKLFDAAMQSMKQRQEVVVISRKDITLDGNKGIELSIKPPESAGAVGTGVCRIYWVPPRLYVVVAGGPDSPESSAARVRFLDSFKLLKS